MGQRGGFHQNTGYLSPFNSDRALPTATRDAITKLTRAKPGRRARVELHIFGVPPPTNMGLCQEKTKFKKRKPTNLQHRAVNFPWDAFFVMNITASQPFLPQPPLRPHFFCDAPSGLLHPHCCECEGVEYSVRASNIYDNEYTEQFTDGNSR